MGSGESFFLFLTVYSLTWIFTSKGLGVKAEEGNYQGGNHTVEEDDVGQDSLADWLVEEAEGMVLLSVFFQELEDLRVFDSLDVFFVEIHAEDFDECHEGDDDDDRVRVVQKVDEDASLTRLKCGEFKWS